jgi:hypothetical protein
MRTHRAAWVGLAVLAALAAAVLGPVDAGALSSQELPVGSRLTTRVLTPDGSDRLDVSLTNGVIRMSAPATNTGSNLREVFWPTGQPSFRDGQVCATWQYESTRSVQEGIALRIVTGLDSRVMSLTVDKNVWAGVSWVLWVVGWDTATPEVFTGIANKDVSAVVAPSGDYEPLPWRVCARVIGSALTFKIWVPAREGEPSWTDPTHTGTATIPAKWTVPGKFGWYVGHVPPAGSARYGNLRVWRFGA